MPKKAKAPIDETPETSTETLTDAELEALTAPEGEDETPAEIAPEADAPSDEAEAAPAPESADSDAEGDEEQAVDDDSESSEGEAAGESGDDDAASEDSEEGEEQAPTSQIAEDGQTIAPPAETPLTEEAPVAEQPSHDDALAQRPLSGHASAEMTGPIDAMPSEAQQHMGQWIKPPEEAEPAEPGQLPTAADLPGTPTDATGIGTQAQEPIASGTQGEAAHGEPSEEQAAAQAPDLRPGKLAGAQPAEAAAPAKEDGDEIFGEPLPQHAPLFDVAGDGLGELKTSAEAAYRASQSLTGFPIEVLDEAHKLLVVELRAAMHSIVRATERLFARKG